MLEDILILEDFSNGLLYSDFAFFLSEMIKNFKDPKKHRKRLGIS